MKTQVNNNSTSLKRKFVLNGRVYSVRFYYGERNEQNHELSYTKFVKGHGHCRFVQCKIEEIKSGGYETVVVTEAVCSPADRFVKHTGRVISLYRAIEKMNVSDSDARKISVYAIGDRHAIQRYQAKHGVDDPLIPCGAS